MRGRMGGDSRFRPAMDMLMRTVKHSFQFAVASVSLVLEGRLSAPHRFTVARLVHEISGINVHGETYQGQICCSGSNCDSLAALLVLICVSIATGAFCYAAFSGILAPLLERAARLRLQARRFVLGSSVVRTRIRRELRKLEDDLDVKFNRTEGLCFTHIPTRGVDPELVANELTRWASSERSHWVSGKLSGTVYHGHDKADRIAVEAYSLFSLSNPLHPNTFPSIRKMEAEVIAMTANLFHSPSPCGAVTSGGTESILMCIRAYKEWGRQAKYISRPNIVVPATIHAAFDKACKYFDIEIRKVPVDSLTMRADPRLMQKQMNADTVAVACSAVAFPHGTLDPVRQIASLARSRNVGCHVDACLGSFLIPFAESSGVNLEPYDFVVDGVTSISCDPHKYGVAPKGCSVVLFRDLSLRHYMYTCAADWTGGVYATATQAGSRPGGIIAGCWAALVVTGMSGYQEMARKILVASSFLKAAIPSINGLRVVGEPALSVIAFTTTDESGCNVFDVLDIMSEKGWDLNALQNPDALHVCITLPLSELVQELVTDLTDAMSVLLRRTKLGGRNTCQRRTAAIYGMMSKVPLEIADEVCNLYLDRALTASSRVGNSHTD